MIQEYLDIRLLQKISEDKKFNYNDCMSFHLYDY